MKKFGLSKKERIKSKKEFELVYSSGSKIISAGNLLKVHFYSEVTDGLPSVKVAFGINKKAGKAYWRNRLRRLLKDCYRLNKHEIIKTADIHRLKLLIVFSPNSMEQQSHRKIKMKNVEFDFLDLLNRLNNKLILNSPRLDSTVDA